MRSFAFAGALLVALTACSSVPTAVPPPTLGAPAHSVAFVVTPLGQQGSSVAPVCSSAPAEIELQAAPTAQPTATRWSIYAGVNVRAVEYDAACTATAATATFTIGNPALVTSTTPNYFLAIPPATAGSINLTGLALGATTLTATFPDGTTATAPIGVYGSLGVSCAAFGPLPVPTYFVYDGTSTQTTATAAWSHASGYLAPTQPGACFGSYQTPPGDIFSAGYGEAIVPGGYAVVLTTSTAMPAPLQALASIRSCSFTSEGTKISIGTLSPSLYSSILLFKTGDGRCVKMATQYLVVNDGTISGYYAISDTSGNFAY